MLVKIDINDQYGRALAQVAYQNHDVGLYMLEHGYAWVYQRYIGSIDEDWQNAYMAAEFTAKEDGLGLWAKHRVCAALDVAQSQAGSGCCRR